MAAICLYFQVHQPHRLRPYTIFDTDGGYFDREMNARIVRKIAAECYLPANAILLKLLEEGKGEEGGFQVSFSFSGTVLDQFAAYVPEVLASFQALAATGRVEILGETSHHSLAFLYEPAEFETQVRMHGRRVEALFGQRPTVFRNTELIYSDQVGALAKEMGFRGVLAEGWPTVLGGRSPDRVFGAGGMAGGVAGGIAVGVGVLMRNYGLSDDIAFRFSRSDWGEHPLTAEGFARRIGVMNPGPVCNLFMDYETFGEHQKAGTGILEFLAHWPRACREAGHRFVRPSGLVGESREFEGGMLAAPYPFSWADSARDLSAWLGNEMQRQAAGALYELGPAARAAGGELVEDFRNLTTSDHFYYMATKSAGGADDQVHAHFSPYGGAHEAYTNFMTVLADLRKRVREGRVKGRKLKGRRSNNKS